MADESGTTTTTEPTTTAPATTGPASTTAPVTSWRDTLPDGLKGEKTLESYKDVGAVAQALVEAKRWQSGAIKIPGKDAKPEEIAAYREKIGVPKSALDYKLTVADGAKPGTTIDAKRWEAAVPTLHKLGFTQEQAQGLAEWAVQEDAARAAAVNEGYLKELDAYADTIGQTAFDRQCQLVERLMDRIATPEMRASLNAAKAAGSKSLWHTNNPMLFQLMAKVATDYAEDGLIDGRVEGIGSPDQMKEKIEAIRKELATIRDDSPRARELEAQMNDLYKALNPG